jgi:flagellar motor switch protein FliG
MSSEMIEEISSEQKAAAVIVSMGADKASLIYKHLSEDDIEKLTLEVAKLKHLEADQTADILDEFYKSCMTQKVVTDGGMEYARSVLEKAFGESTAQQLLERVTKFLKVRPFEFIRKADPKNLYTFLAHERPQTIALVLSYADADQAAGVISNLPKDVSIQVVECIARLESVSPEAIKIVESQLRKRFENIMTTDYTAIGGIDYIADVMNNMDRSNEKFIFDELSKRDEELTETIRKKMFVFEDILSLDNRSIQRFIRDCDVKDLVYALKGSDENVRQVIFANMSGRMAESIQSDLEITVNVLRKDVEEAQQRIVGVIRRLEAAGELIIVKGGKDEIIV